MSEYETITIEKKGQVDWLTLNRPEALNALNSAMVTELRNYFEALREDRDTRIVILQGAGRAFCAGLDIKDSSIFEDAPFGGGMGFQGYIADIMIRMRRCPQPIISLLHGSACGGGFALALASDIRIAGNSTRMNAAFIKIGLSACDVGVSYFLPRLIGTSIASELMLTGRFIDAERALRVNLVSEVVADAELAEAAQAYIDDMLATSPIGLRMTKEGLTQAIDANSLEAAMAIENRNQLICGRTRDAKEGMLAFLEKRPPQYGGS